MAPGMSKMQKSEPLDFASHHVYRFENLFWATLLAIVGDIWSFGWVDKS